MSFDVSLSTENFICHILKLIIRHQVIQFIWVMVLVNLMLMEKRFKVGIVAEVLLNLID